MSASTRAPAAPAGRIHLEGVPRLSFEPIDGRCPETVPFPSALRAILEFLGETEPGRRIAEHGREWRLDPTYVRLHAACGAAFRLTWGPGWQLDNPTLAYISEHPGEPHTRAFALAGRAFEFVNAQMPEREALFRARARESLEGGVPLLAFGLAGPPEASIITGLEEDGAVAIGWSFFQSLPPWSADVELEPSGELRGRNWAATCEALALLGAKSPPPDPRLVARSTIEFALRVARTRWIEWAGRHNGHAAFTAWARALRDDGDWAALGRPSGAAALFQRYEVHDDAVGVTAEARWYAARWCDQTAEEFPAAAGPLGEASRHFDAMHDRMWEAWRIIGGPPRTPEKARALAEPGTRHVLAALVAAARTDDVAAIGALEQALRLI